MTVASVKLTAEQYLQLGADPVGVRLELLDGELCVSPSPIPNHSRVIVRLSHLLMGHVIQHSLGELFTDTDTIFSDGTVLRPDISFYNTARCHLIGATFLKAPPDLCIEVVSPSSAISDRGARLVIYQNSGVAHYWIVDPVRRSLEPFDLVNGAFHRGRLGSNSEILHLKPFLDLAIPLSDLWPLV